MAIPFVIEWKQAYIITVVAMYFSRMPVVVVQAEIKERISVEDFEEI